MERYNTEIFGVKMTGATGTKVEKNKVISFHTHSHLYYEMLLYSPFKGHIIVNGQKIEIKEPTAVLITPADFHSTVALGGGEYIKLYCHSDILSADKERYHPSYLRDDGNGLISKLFESAWKNKDNHNYLKTLMSLAAMEITEFGKRLKSPAVAVGGSLVSKAMGIINENFSEDITLISVAKTLHVSPQHLSAVFSKTAGVSFNKYLTDKRLRYAATLLSSGDINVTEACFSSGYRNLSHFVRSFKNMFGVSPGVYGKDKHRHQ